MKKGKKLSLKNIAYKLKENVKLFLTYLKYNRQYISFVILTLISCFLVRVLTIGKIWSNGSFFDLAVIVIIGSFTYLFKPKKQFNYLFIVMLIITVLNIINTIYYAFFTSFVSFGLLASLGQTAEVTDAVFEKLKIIHFIFVIFPLIFVFINKYLASKDYFNLVEKIEDSKKLFVSVLIVGGILLFMNISTLTASHLGQFAKQWNREFVVDRFGVIVYQGNDIVQTIRVSISSIFGKEEAYENFKEFYKNKENTNKKNKYTNIYEGYNVIGIHMESIMTFLIDLKMNGVEVTPNLNKLVKESAYFDNFYAQVSSGTSSDTEFTYSSSLMPVQSGTVFVSYYNRNYNTLQKLLAQKGYYTFSMHGNKASMWNRSKMHPSLGYMDFYSEEAYTVDEEVGLGLSDHSFFIQSEQILSDIKKMVDDGKDYNNYYGTIITLSNHTPFSKDGEPFSDFDVTYHTGKIDEEGNEIIYDYLEGTTLGNYIKSVHYADQCLGEFIEYIKQNDEFNKTLFVFYGDHSAQLSRGQFAKYINFNPETGEQYEQGEEGYVDYDYYENELFKKTPLIIYAKDKKIVGKYSYPMGMIDVMPTIGNMIGINNKYALGHDIFNIKYDNTIVYPNGNFMTNKVYYSNSKNEYIVFGKYTIDEEYIDEKKKYAEDILAVSDDIIVYDLIELDTESGKNE